MFGFGDYSGRPNNPQAKKGAFAKTPTPTNINRPGRSDTTSRPAFLSDMGSKSGAKPTRVFDYGSQYKDSMAADLDDMINKSQGTGVAAFNQTGQGGSGSAGSNIAQQILGDSYSQALALGYKPSELIDMVTKAQSYNRGIDVDKFKTGLDRFEAFQEGGPGTQFDGQTFLSVSRPELTANAPTLAQLLGDIGGGISNMVGAGADFILGGGTAGKILQGLQNKFNQGKDYVSGLTNPGNLTQRLNAAGPEAQRKYALFMQQPGMTYQRAFEMATGQQFASGGITTL